MNEMTVSKFIEVLTNLIENKKYKDLISLLPDIEEIKTIIDKSIGEIKEYIKYEQIDSHQIDDYKIIRNVYMKYKIKDIKELKEKYPIDKYPDIYNITLSAKAKDIITDASLITTVPVETVRISKVKEIDI